MQLSLWILIILTYLLIVFFPIPIPPLNCVIKSFFTNYFFRLLVWIFKWSVCHWKMWSATILCFFLTPWRSGDCEWIQRGRHSFLPHLWCQPHMMTSQLLSLRCTSQSSSLLLRPKVGSNIKFFILQIRANYLFLYRFLV